MSRFLGTSFASLTLLLTLTPSPVFAAEPRIYRCTVDAVYPENADFFRVLSSPMEPPIATDEIEIDLGADEIAELTFNSGRGIDLRGIAAKLYKQPSSSSFNIDFVGAHHSRQDDYVGTVFAKANDRTAQIQVSATRLSFPVESHQLDMNCIKKP